MPVSGKLALLAAPLILTACKTTQTAVTDTSCKAFVPVYYSRLDTTQTSLEIRRHNAAYDALCAAER